MPDVLNGKLLSAMHLLHACLNLPTLLPLAFPHSEINDLQGRGGASNVCTGCLLCGLLLFSTCDRRCCFVLSRGHHLGQLDLRRGVCQVV